MSRACARCLSRSSAATRFQRVDRSLQYSYRCRTHPSGVCIDDAHWPLCLGWPLVLLGAHGRDHALGDRHVLRAARRHAPRKSAAEPRRATRRFAGSGVMTTTLVAPPPAPAEFFAKMRWHWLHNPKIVMWVIWWTIPFFYIL